uniref:Fibroblast growth factor binding protein 1b n=1 Tax=Sinocyclocheilus grahami TaxID=75366 RepID=A0A672MMD8_SINGR
MRTICSAAFLLVCFIWATNAQAQNSSNQGNGINHIESTQNSRQQQPQKGSDNNISVQKAKFTTKDKAQCSWVARGEDKYTMTVTCKPGNGDGFTCKYTAKPATCTEYGSNPEGYWKQIARSVKKQKKLCADPRAMIRAGMCKRAPLDAHFKLSETSQAKPPKTEKTPIATNTTPPDTKRQCTERIDHSEVAKEKCGDSWASLCAFLFTVIQSGDC